jgi:hypothetical protein
MLVYVFNFRFVAITCRLVRRFTSAFSWVKFSRERIALSSACFRWRANLIGC